MRETLVKSEEFKDSPVGRIPKDWEVKRLASITSKIIDGTHFTPTYVEDGVPFLRVTDIQSTTIDFDNVKRIPLQEHRLITARCNPQIGDILYSKNGTVGITKLVDWHQEFSIFVSLCLIRPITTLVNPLYLAKILQSFLIEQQIRVRSKQMTVINLHLEEIREFFIPLPKLDEQDRIVKILDTLDEAIAHTSSLIAKLKQMKAGLLHDLLTRGLDENGELRDAIAHPEQFKDSPLGQIPKDWHIHTMGDLVELAIDGPFGSNLKTEHYVNQPEVRVVRLQNIESGYFDDSDKAYVSYAHGSKLRRHEVVSGDLLVACLGDDNHPIARACLYPVDAQPGIVKADCFRVRLQSSMAIHAYVMHVLNCPSTRGDIKLLGQGVTRDRVNLTTLQQVRLRVPPVTEQIRIAEIIEAHNTRIRKEEAYRDKLKLQKQGLMHDLLTGKVRVKDA